MFDSRVRSSFSLHSLSPLILNNPISLLQLDVYFNYQT